MAKSQVRFELDKAGVGKLLKSQDMQNVLNAHASAMLSGLGAGYETDSFVGFDRAHAVVKAVSREARRENSENNTLLKAVRR